MTVSKTQPESSVIISDFSHPQSGLVENEQETGPRVRVSFYHEILIGLILMATPFLLFPRGYGLLALLALPTIWLIRWRVLHQIIPRTAFDWPILLILMMVLLSIWTTFDINFSIGKISSLLLGITIFYAIIDLARTRTTLQVILFFFLLIGVGIALISALGTQWTDKFPLVEAVLSRLPQVLRGVHQAEEGFNPNQVGGVLVFFVPLQLILLLYWLRARVGGLFGGIFISLSLLVTGAMLLLAQSRGALGGLVIGLVIIAAIQTRWGKILGITGLIALGVMFSNPRLIGELVTSGIETEAAGTLRLDDRLEIWSRGLLALADFPFGMGMNTFRQVLPILYPLFKIDPTREVAHAHNHLLQAGLDLGIPGLIAYLALWLGAGLLLFQTITYTHSQFYRAVGLGLMGGFIAHFIYGLTDAVALGSKPGFVFWWALGLIVALYQLSGDGHQLND